MVQEGGTPKGDNKEVKGLSHCQRVNKGEGYLYINHPGEK